MDGMFWLNVVSRWLHVVAAVIAVGGFLCIAWALLPGARSAGAGAEPTLEATFRQFKSIFHAAIGLLLLTGVYNFMTALPRVEGLAALKPVYHGVIGIKILLALAVIGLGSAWIGKATRGELAILQRDNLLIATVVLALIVLLLSATLRRVWDRHPRLLTTMTNDQRSTTNEGRGSTDDRRPTTDGGFARSVRSVGSVRSV